MIRLLCALGALLVLFVLGESFLREHQRTVRRTAGALRLLTPELTAAVAQIEVRAAGRSWHYVRRGGHLVFPSVSPRLCRQPPRRVPAPESACYPGDLRLDRAWGLGPLWPRPG